MKRQALYILLALLGFTTLRAQVNLVHNSSFEDTLECPYFVDQLHFATYWSSPTNSSPDYLSINFCNVFINSNVIQLPNNDYLGYQQPRTGNSLGGAVLYANNDSAQDREYLQVQLTDTLVNGKIYYVKYYVSLADKFSRYAISSFGAYFSNDSIREEGIFPFLPILNFNPQVSIDAFISDTSSWTEVSGYFTAQGGEKYLLIGNFKPQEDVDTIIFNSTQENKVAYYLIDDVSVMEYDSLLEVEETHINRIAIYPNPAQDFVSIEIPNYNTQTQLSIYNLTGQLISQKQITRANQNIAITELGNGMYIFIVQSGDRVIGRQRVVISE